MSQETVFIRMMKTVVLYELFRVNVVIRTKTCFQICMEPTTERVSTLLYYTLPYFRTSSTKQCFDKNIYISNFIVVMLQKNSNRTSQFLAYDRKKQVICRVYFFEKFNFKTVNEYLALKWELCPSPMDADSNRITTCLLLEAFFAS